MGNHGEPSGTIGFPIKNHNFWMIFWVPMSPYSQDCCIDNQHVMRWVRSFRCCVGGLVVSVSCDETVISAGQPKTVIFDSNFTQKAQPS